MAYGLLIAVTLQIFFIMLFYTILIPFRYTPKITLMALGAMTLVTCICAGALAMTYGTYFFIRYGFFTIGAPIFFSLYLLSNAKGLRFLFIVLTAIIFHQGVAVLLMVLRVSEGGFTPFYFLMNFVGFGLLLLGGYWLRRDFQKIVFTYKHEFGCLCLILSLIFVISRLFLPVIGEGRVDTSLLLVTLTLDLLILLLYSYIAVTFHSLNQHCDQARRTLSLQYQLEEANSRNALLQVLQESGELYCHDLLHHLALIRALLERDQLDRLYAYMDEVEKKMANSLSQRCCQNETANLLLGSFLIKSQKLGIQLIIDAQIPSILAIDNIELCTLLSNALENAITATVGTSDQVQKIIHLMIKPSDGKLLILVKNPYQGDILMDNGLPQSARPGHGFGVKSMEVIIQKYDGLSSFEAKDGLFTLHIVI